MPLTKDEMLAWLGAEKLDFTLYEHPAVFTVEESQKHCAHIPGVHCKNLFLKDQKTDALFLVTVPDERVIDLKALPGKVGARRFSFGKPDLLMEFLGVLPGSVTPLSLINDTARRVKPVLDRWMLDQPLVNYHPLVNTATVTMTPQGLLAFMEKLGYRPTVLDLEA